MAQTKSTKKSSTSARSKAAKAAAEARRNKKSNRREILAGLFLLLGVFSLLGYFKTSGIFIDFFSQFLKGLFGWGFFAVPPVLFLCAVILGFHRNRPVRLRIVCALFLPLMTGALAHLFSAVGTNELSGGLFKELWTSGTTLESGGALSGAITALFTVLFSKAGAAVLLICAALFLLLTALNKTIVGIVDAARQRVQQRERSPYVEDNVAEPIPAPVKMAPPRSGKRVIDIPLDEPKTRRTKEPPVSKEPFEAGQHDSFFDANPRVKTPDEIVGGAAAAAAAAEKTAAAETPEATPEDMTLDIPFMEKKPAGQPEKLPPEKKPVPAEEPKKNETTATDVFEVPENKPDGDKPKTAYTYPPIHILSAGVPTSSAGAADEVRRNIERLQAAFKSFGVNVRVTSYTRGPTVTRYEAELEAGVKLNKLTSLSDDIALSLGTSGVRIGAMPNKISTVGIEVPNKSVSTVYLRDIIDSQNFKRSASKLTFAIGKNIGGEAIVGDISKLPHLLVAGTTGSGKSVCLNSLILSILYKATPEEVRFIMIDPKMVEFRVYNGIPHLLVPVVTEVKKAAGALQWAVVEMMKRYRIFSESNARDIESYNKIMAKTEDGEIMSKIVVVIDELADLMLTAAKEVEESICRVAQMGRAAGVHLVIATQSPRADVITGLMKANIPSRIALKVSSSLESRIILDAGGAADKLVGNGDMLFAPIGAHKPIRIQGTWVTDAEREQVVEHIKKSGDAQYSEEVMGEIEKAAEDKSSGGKNSDTSDGPDCDEMLPQAVEVIFESGQASVSMLQRRLKLGYSRAARIVDQMEQMGIVGPFEGSKPRPLLITRQQWYEMQYVQGTAPDGVGADVDTPEPEPEG